MTHNSQDQLRTHMPRAELLVGLPKSIVALAEGRNLEYPDADFTAAVGSFVAAADARFEQYGDVIDGTKVLYGTAPDPDRPGQQGQVILARRVGEDGTPEYDYQVQFPANGDRTELRTFMIDPVLASGEPNTNGASLHLYPLRQEIPGIRDPEVINELTRSIDTFEGTSGPKNTGMVRRLLGRIGTK